jgi:acetylornithine/succinyldiaminopimelate/putrescine aminotransferase
MCRIKEALIEIRKVAKKYSQKSATEILNDLIKSQPGSEGKWFAAAKDAELFEQAIELARRSPTDPRTHTRAARDYARLCRNNVE